MQPDEWFAKREQMAAAFKTDPKDVPAEAVWYLEWPPTPPTDSDVARAREIAARLAQQPTRSPDGVGPDEQAEGGRDAPAAPQGA